MIDLRTESKWTQPWTYGVRHFVVAWKGELRGRSVVWYERVLNFTMSLANFFFPLNYLIATIEKAVFDRSLPPESDPSPLPLNTHEITPPSSPRKKTADSSPTNSEKEMDFERVESVVND